MTNARRLIRYDCCTNYSWFNALVMVADLSLMDANWALPFDLISKENLLPQIWQRVNQVVLQLL